MNKSVKNMPTRLASLRVGVVFALSLNCMESALAASLFEFAFKTWQAEEAGNYDEALRLYSASVEFDSLFCDGYLGSGAIYQRQGKDDLAISFLEKGLACLNGPAVHSAFDYSETMRQVEIFLATKRLEKLKAATSQSPIK